jgi:hypothetical protein
MAHPGSRKRASVGTEYTPTNGKSIVYTIEFVTSIHEQSSQVAEDIESPLDTLHQTGCAMVVQTSTIAENLTTAGFILEERAKRVDNES